MIAMNEADKRERAKRKELRKLAEGLMKNARKVLDVLDMLDGHAARRESIARRTKALREKTKIK